MVRGEGPVRTGVTAILPHDGNLFQEKVPAAAYVLNGFGKSIGICQVNELGNIETPIVLTNTLNVGIVADAVVEWSLGQNPEIGVNTGTVNPVVGEINDGSLNDIQGRHVHKEDVFSAIRNAVSGPVDEGSVGAGAGSSCMGWKGGIGVASRLLPGKLGGFTVGVLVQSNFGGVLTVNGAPVGRELGRFAYKECLEERLPESPDEHLENGSAVGPVDDGSVMVIIATNAPMDHRQLRRLAKRAGMGLARTGFFGSNGSGDFFISFSTAQRVPHSSGSAVLTTAVMSNDAVSALFLAVVEATEEAVLNSILRATTVVGRDGNTVEAINIDDLLRVMRKYNTLNWHETLPPRGRA